MAITREIIVADTDQEAEALAREAGYSFGIIFVPFGFGAAIADLDKVLGTNQQLLVFIGRVFVFMEALQQFAKVERA